MAIQPGDGHWGLSTYEVCISGNALKRKEACSPPSIPPPFQPEGGHGSKLSSVKPRGARAGDGTVTRWTPNTHQATIPILDHQPRLRYKGESHFSVALNHWILWSPITTQQCALKNTPVFINGSAPPPPPPPHIIQLAEVQSHISLLWLPSDWLQLEDYRDRAAPIEKRDYPAPL